jgi:4-phospho-D-threonate 3-dehydrogenase / 4-phospho-D-erythronate 3-dehydrogenase
MRVPIIAVTLGDPAGVGPEVVVRALSSELPLPCRPIAIGSRPVVARALEVCRLASEVRVIDGPARAEGRSGVIELIDLDNVDVTSLQMGRIQAQCGRAAYQYIERAARLALAGEVDAVATAPINKESLRAGLVPHLDHTAIFGALANVEDPLTMFETRGLRVFFLTRHVPLRKVCDLVTKERLLDYFGRCLEALGRIGLGGGTLAVAGLNPHGGEGGMFGAEEREQIAPAVAEAQAMGLRVEGPVPADSVFHLAYIGRFSAVLSLYHDQGHIATKTLDFERTVAITHGLPFLRTSVDHGTAFDIAGTGAASAVSMVEAIAAAARYAWPVPESTV